MLLFLLQLHHLLMLGELTAELLDLRASLRGVSAPAFAMVQVCCCCCCCIGQGSGE